MDLERILCKMEEIMVKLEFEPVEVNCIKYMRYHEHYCKITFIKDWSAFVIESADTIQDAEKGVLEDGDLYYMDIPEDALLEQFKADLIRDYIIE